MKEHQHYLIEREKIDYFIDRGYRINGITENLSGAFIEFVLKDVKSGEISNEILHIQTANGRKYFSALLLKQIQSVT
ncbi:hypothetical protein GLW07_11895 [Bacillus hwajinpoensis]|uniref:Uncharacterized protein n=1 Tax=Guptibacillus hwajinpoensis TaxID=208199 RepID=A0A845EZQ8_9BACL|nr:MULTISPECIES: hypothetical protein [Bacillaceae]MCA0990488.1 hypothetical protein [Pseudalkalibacillus hwajinpoensis]MYL64053.1 hypothetical protein [Pseudalkalibacillus hwajinpoensis]PFG13287.1 hypothetical protein ATG70_1489 [Bacillus sp. es.036]